MDRLDDQYVEATKILERNRMENKRYCVCRIDYSKGNSDKIISEFETFKEAFDYLKERKDGDLWRISPDQELIGFYATSRGDILMINDEV